MGDRNNIDFDHLAYVEKLYGTRPVDGMCNCHERRVSPLQQLLSKKMNGSSGGNKKIKLSEKIKCAEGIDFLSLINNDENLIAFTGVSTKLLDILSTAVEKVEGIMGSQKKFPNSAREKVVLCLCKLRLNLSIQCLAILFNVTPQSCNEIFQHMIQVLSEIFKKSTAWTSLEQHPDTLPKCLKHFEKVRVVLGCMKIYTKIPECIRCIVFTSTESIRHLGLTVKFLIGTTMCGCILFVSQAYGGRFSNKQIIDQIGFMEVLNSNRDAVLVDKEFDIDMECLQANVKMIKPPSLVKNSQVSSKDASHLKEVATARLPIKKSIQKMKSFNIFSQKMTKQTELKIDKIMKIIVGLVKASDLGLVNDESP